MTVIPDISYSLEYPYTRTTGPVIGPFLTGLRDGKILGIRCGDQVLCPPLEFDPETGATLDVDMVEIGPGATVTGWTWVANPTRKHPSQDPFAFALVQVDGADTPMVQAVLDVEEDEMSTGMRVQAQYRDERFGAITDLYFVPEGKAAEQSIEAGDEPVEITEHHIAVQIDEPLHPFRVRYAEALLDGKLLAVKSPASGKVYIPSRGYDQMERILLTEEDELYVEAVGTVVGFTEITPVQYYGQEETKPYIRCSILLDGTDQPVTGVDIRHIEKEDFRVGMRMAAEWKPEGERELGEIDNRWGSLPEGLIERWESTGEPDIDPDTLKGYAW